LLGKRDTGLRKRSVISILLEPILFLFASTAVLLYALAL
jgi:hypothetical protein